MEKEENIKINRQIIERNNSSHLVSWVKYNRTGK